jgi:hypothetical protein
MHMIGTCVAVAVATGTLHVSPRFILAAVKDPNWLTNWVMRDPPGSAVARCGDKIVAVQTLRPRATSARRGALLEPQTDWLGVGA